MPEPRKISTDASRIAERTSTYISKKPLRRNLRVGISQKKQRADGWLVERPNRRRYTGLVIPTQEAKSRRWVGKRASRRASLGWLKPPYNRKACAGLAERPTRRRSSGWVKPGRTGKQARCWGNYQPEEDSWRG